MSKATITVSATEDGYELEFIGKMVVKDGKLQLSKDLCRSLRSAIEAVVSGRRKAVVARDGRAWGHMGAESPRVGEWPVRDV